METGCTHTFVYLMKCLIVTSTAAVVVVGAIIRHGSFVRQYWLQSLFKRSEDKKDSIFGNIFGCWSEKVASFLFVF